MNAQNIRDHKDIIGSCGNKLGRVDRLEGGSIKLTIDSAQDGPTAADERAGGQVKRHRQGLFGSGSSRATLARLGCLRTASQRSRFTMEQATNTDDPIGQLFGGMGKLGPGSDADTLHVLRALPRRQFRVVVDAGCGAGRQTLALAREFGTPVHAVDSHEPFLNDLVRRVGEAGVGHLVQTHRMDMKDIPHVFSGIDLLWSEGAAYNIGFPNALATWATALLPDGFAVVSELSWLTEQAPKAARDFFRSGYPDMRPVRGNVAAAEGAGFKVLATHTLPRQAWVDDYYDVLGPRAKALLHHPSPAVRDFATETVREIEVFQASGDSYGYVFYILQRA